MFKYDEALTTYSGKKVTWGFELECMYLSDHYTLFQEYLRKITNFTLDMDGSVKIDPNDFRDKQILKIIGEHDYFYGMSGWNILQKFYTEGEEHKSEILPVDLATIVKVYSNLKKLFERTVPKQIKSKAVDIYLPEVVVHDFTITADNRTFPAGYVYGRGYKTGTYYVLWNSKTHEISLSVSSSTPVLDLPNTFNLGTVHFNREDPMFSNFIPTPKKTEQHLEEDEVDLPLVYTNSHCGFHVHVGLNHETKFMEELLWMWFQMTLSNMPDKPEDMDLNTKKSMNDFYHYADEFSDFAFNSENYAPTDNYSFAFYFETKDALIKSVKQTLDNFWKSILTKYNVVRLHHEYATMEWRGPRGFFEGGSDVKNVFVNFIYPFMQFLLTLSENDAIKFKDYSLSKKEFFQILANNPALMSFIEERNKKISLDIHGKEYKILPTERKFLGIFKQKNKDLIFDRNMEIEIASNGISFYIINGKLESKKMRLLPLEVKGVTRGGTLKNFEIPEDKMYNMTGDLENCEIDWINIDSYGPHRLENCKIKSWHVSNTGFNDIVKNIIDELVLYKMSMVYIDEDLDGLQQNVIKHLKIFGSEVDYDAEIHNELEKYKLIIKQNKVMKISILKRISGHSIAFDLQENKKFTSKELLSISKELHDIVQKINKGKKHV